MPLENDQQLSSVDADEVEYYHNLADTWWDKTGPFWPLHRLNELRVNYLREKLSRLFGRDAKTERPLDGLTVLDVGCGGGILSESVSKLGAEVCGIDVVEKNIQVARVHAERSGLTIDYRQIEVEQLAEQQSGYDIVLNMEVVEHVADLPGFQQACNSLVKPGGAQCISTINRNPLAFLVAIFGAEYVLGWLPKGTHHYRKLVKPKELELLLERDNFRVVSQTGVRVNPFSRSMHLTRLMAINYMLLAQKDGQPI